jgi:hypothetical protein
MDVQNINPATPERPELTGWRRTVRDHFVLRLLFMMAVYFSIAGIVELLIFRDSFNEFLHKTLSNAIFFSLFFALLYENQKRKWVE